MTNKLEEQYFFSYLHHTKQNYTKEYKSMDVKLHLTKQNFIIANFLTKNQFYVFLPISALQVFYSRSATCLNFSYCRHMSENRWYIYQRGHNRLLIATNRSVFLNYVYSVNTKPYKEVLTKIYEEGMYP